MRARLAAARLAAACLAAACLLAACDGPPPAPVYRDTLVPISSAAAFDPARFAGLWHEVARFPGAPGRDCADGRLTFAPPAGATLAVLRDCPAAGGIRRAAGTARLVGPGRLMLRLSGDAEAAYWVLWVDSGYRTAVVGTPSGDAGWILDRGPDIPEDRLLAALEVLRFNGYEVARLVR